MLQAQRIAVKVNSLYWATLTPNLSAEIGEGDKSTLELNIGLNTFTFSNNKKFKHWLFQPEFRYWICEKFNGSFIGVHAHAARFNVGGLDIPLGRLSILKNHRYEGYLYGAGVSYGYQWVITPRWNFELNMGAGYARINYTQYPCVKCGVKEDDGDYDYWGVTKTAVSLIYMIK